MDHFRNAKSVRLKSHHNKYLLAEEDEESVTQDRNGSSKTARWTVEFSHDPHFIRLKSCFGKYLTASNHPFLLGMTGLKVSQSLPRKLTDSSIEWEPLKDGFQVKLRTRYGNFLRANGGLPPWRNSLTHDIPHRTHTQEWVLWDVDVLEIQVRADVDADTNAPDPDPPNVEEPEINNSDINNSARLESVESFGDSSVESFDGSFRKVVDDGRLIYYSVAEDDGDVDEGVEGESFSFKGNGVEELTQKLEEETGIDDIVVCTRSPLNGQLYPLRLRLPPNNATMHVVVVPSSSKVGRGFTKQEAV